MVAIKKPNQQHKTKLYYLSFFAVVIVALLARIIFSTYSSIWHDEGFSVALTNNSFIKIWQLTALDVHPPFYYELLHLWRIVFGDSVFALRSLSILCGTIVVALVMYLTSLISNRKAALLAGVFVALNPILIHFSQETRMYALESLLVLIMLLATIWIIRKPKQIWPYLVFTFSATAALYTHYLTALVIFAVWIYFVSLQFNKKSTDYVKILFNWRWWLANAAIIILFIPWLPSFYKQLTRAQGLDWLLPASIYTYFDVIWQFITMTDARKLPLMFYLVIPAIILAAAIYISLTEKNKHHYFRLLSFVTFIPLAIAILISLKKPIIHERYFLFAAITICIILAIAMVELFYNKHKALLYMSVSLLLVIQAVGIRNVHSQFSHRMDKVMEYINSNCEDANLLLNAELYTYFDSLYYNRTSLTPQLYTGVLTGVTKLNGYGESSLIHNKNIYLQDYSSVLPGSKVCLIGKNKHRPYYDTIPANWQLQSMLEDGYIQGRIYLVK